MRRIDVEIEMSRAKERSQDQRRRDKQCATIDAVESGIDATENENLVTSLSDFGEGPQESFNPAHLILIAFGSST